MNLDTYRRLRKWTHGELAREIGTSRSYATKICNGERPSVDLAEQISAATNGAVTIADLLYPDGIRPGAVVARPPECASDGAGQLDGTEVDPHDGAAHGPLLRRGTDQHGQLGDERKGASDTLREVACA